MLKIILLTSVFALGAVMDVNDNAAVLGEWYTGDKKGKVLIYECGNKLCGKIAWLADPPAEYGNPPRDVNNPENKLRDRKLIGMNILEGFERTDENYWENGTIYDPKNGKTYKCNMELDGDLLKVRGYIGFSLLGRTEEWTRVK